ncbi:hypothetical protein ABZT03_32245 [Streptomyces sp. NPDC005574]|uniref:hypothetical protein n=1 Tax=Streptomyces sp. NPDC005574 TaxID=3156891 RepID=UPI0033A36CDD
MDPSGSAPEPAHSGRTTQSGAELSAAERAEYERLRRAAGMRHKGLRRAGAGILLVLTLVLAPLAVVAVWVNDIVSDTDRYVQTVAPLASDPAVQKTVTDRLTARVVKKVDVRAVTDSLTKVLEDAGSPPRVVQGAQALEAPLRSAVDTVVRRNVERVVTSDAFRQAWEDSNRRAHAAVVGMLTGEGQGALRAEGDSIQLDIGTVVDQVRQRLVDRGFDKAAAIPDSERTVTLFRTEELGKAQDGMRLLDILGTWLPLVVLALGALTVWTAPGHRLMLMITSLGVSVMMVVLLVALAVVRRVYLDAVPVGALPPDTAAAIFDTFLRFLRDSTRTLLVVFLIVALTAYLYGPGRPARWTRAMTHRGATAAGRTLSGAGLRTGSAGRWLGTHHTWITGVAIGAGALTLLLWNHPTIGGVVLVVGLILIVLALVAVLAAAAAEPDRTARGTGDAVP